MPSRAFHERYARLPTYRYAPPPGSVSTSPPVLPPNPWADTVFGWQVGRDGNATYDCAADAFIDVTISANDRCEHTLLLGKTGQGKSNTMRYLISQDVRAGRGCCVLDPHGKLIEDVLRTIPFGRENDVIYLDAADDDHPFGLNFFQAPRGASPREKSLLIDGILQAFEKGWGRGWAGSAETWLKVCAWTFMENRRGTMAMIPRLLTDRDYREAFLPRIRDPFTRDKWRAAVNMRTGEIRGEEITPILTRLYKFLGNPLIANIVGQEKTTLDFDMWMAAGKIVLIKLPEGGRDGIGKEAVQLLGTMILQLIVNAGYGREEGSVLWPVYCDEFQHYVTPDIPEILQNLRKYGVGLTLATQSFANIADPDIRDRLLGAGSLIAYQVTEKDARVVAGAFREGMRLLEDYRYDREGNVEYHRPGKAEIADRLANLRTLLGVGKSLVRTNTGEYVVQTPDMDATPLREGLRAKRSQIIQGSREQYCRPRFLVERELRRALVPEEGGDAEDNGTGNEAHNAVPSGAPSVIVTPSVPPPATPRTRRRGVIAPLPEEEQDGL